MLLSLLLSTQSVRDGRPPAGRWPGVSTSRALRTIHDSTLPRSLSVVYCYNVLHLCPVSRLPGIVNRISPFSASFIANSADPKLLHPSRVPTSLRVTRTSFPRTQLRIPSLDSSRYIRQNRVAKGTPRLHRPHGVLHSPNDSIIDV
jgi:hypothetical protein